MTMNWKRNSKKYIAGILTIALAVGVGQSYGSMEVNAQERTLPGIEKLVQDTVASSDGTFHILEIVPAKENATIGYLAGGEEPVAEGRKLSEMPSVTERQNAMNTIGANLSADAVLKEETTNGPVTFSTYSEGSGNARTEELKGRFVYCGNNSGRYHYQQIDAVYQKIADNEQVSANIRYNRYSVLETANDGNSSLKSVTPVFSNKSTGGSNGLETEIVDSTGSTRGYAEGRYAISEQQLTPGDTSNFDPGNYDGKTVYQKVGTEPDAVYTYMGQIVYGTDSALPGSFRTTSAAISVPVPGVSDNDPEIATQAASVLGSNANNIVTYGNSDISKNLYIIDHAAPDQARLWATWDATAGAYQFDTTIASAYIVDFQSNENGDYYVSRMTVSNIAGDYRLRDTYVHDETGNYKLVTPGSLQVTYRDEDPSLSYDYDFVGDDRETALDTVSYNGGFYNKEWFKKNVLNLTGTSRYENGTATGDDIDTLKIEVTTLTLQQLADLADVSITAEDAYCGLNLQDVNLIYFSGQGTYAQEPSNMTSAATMLAKMVFGMNDSGVRSDASRVPVIMDYNFYAKNSAQGNEVLKKLALTLLQVSDDTVATALNSQGDAYWGTLSADTLKNTVDVSIRSYAAAMQVTGADTLALDTLKEYLTENVYLNNDSSRPYAASDYLTDIKSDTSRAWIYTEVLKEIQYENFLIAQENSTAATLKEEISKASVTRYILNWYLHRSQVKDAISVLDLEPCYDFGTGALSADAVKAFMGQSSYGGNIAITQMASAEFIGKVEDLNDRYDMIYVGARTGTMNIKSGKTVYNDRSMNGLIYTHIGDLYDYNSESDDNKNRLRDDSLSHDANVYRGPGNDMNSTREKEFEQFISAGYPVIFADDLLTNVDGDVSVNKSTVDQSSYFYQLIQFALSKDESGKYKYWQESVFAESQMVAATRETTEQKNAREERQRIFGNHLNLSKLQIEWVKNLGEDYMPTELHYNGDGINDTFLKMTDGVYYLQYIFALSNDAAASQISTTYDCKLYIDKNSDGRFSGSDVIGQELSSTEELSGLNLYVRSGEEWKEVSENDNGHYELRTGYTYKVVRRLPDDYQGVLPWKMIFYDNADTLIRTAVSGYTAVDRGERKPISVLQLMSDRSASSGKTLWNLESDSEVKSLLNGVREFNVSIKSVKTSSFINGLLTDDQVRRLRTEEQISEAYYNAAYNTFQQYDMLILGFGDNYQFGSKNESLKNMAVSEAIRDYIEDGKSVLFTHDSSSYINSTAGNGKNWYWGYEFNKTMRAAVGLDRYGALREYYDAQRNNSRLSDAQRKRYDNYYNILNTQYNYDTAWKPGTDRSSNQTVGNIEGPTKYTVVRYVQNRINAILGKGTSYADFYFPIRNSLFYQGMDKTVNSQGKITVLGDYKNFGDGAGPDMTVTQVNQGQITNYPYRITTEEQQTLTVAATHYQWLQPNMELDKDGDGKNDIVVWYCLSDLSDNAKSRKTQFEWQNGRGNDNGVNLYNVCPKDIVNNYYIYSMGNVTYSGAGHTEPTGKAEKKLFVNTMIAAYNAGTKAPSVFFQDNNGNTIDSVYMMYDAANKMILDRSNNIQVNFKATDYNILSSTTEIRVELFKESTDADAMEIAYGKSTLKVKPLSGLTVTNSAGTAVNAHVIVGGDNRFTEGGKDYFAIGTAYYSVTNDGVYTLAIPALEMGLFSGRGKVTLNDQDATTIYIRATTVYDNGTKRTEGAVKSLTVSAAELFDLD